jgi:hypothetical protein
MMTRIRRFGHSTDHRADRPQTVIGLAVTKEGIPVRVWSWPGNAADASVIKTVRADLARWGLHRVLWVGDRGFTSAENRQLLRTGGGHVLFAELLRGPNQNAQALARPGRYRQVADNLHVKQWGSATAPPGGGSSWSATPRKPNATPPPAPGT